MEIANSCYHTFCFENHSCATGTRAFISYFTHDSLNIHPTFILGLLFVTKFDSVVVFAIDFSIESIVKGRHVQIGFTFIAAQAVFVHHTGLGNDLVHLKNLGLASDTCII
jgi:hypothetical protein